MASIKGKDASPFTFGTKNLLRGLIMLTAVLTAGTTGYMLIEKWPFLDALYMTVITITTVGFKEVSSVSDAGRVFTLILIFTGIGIIGYTFGMVNQAMIEFQISAALGRKILGAKIKAMRNHYIICGYGKIGKVIVQELLSKKNPVIVIDSNPDLKEQLETIGVPCVIGDATNEDILIETGIEQAKGLISLVSSNADNLFITITAKGLKPDLFILSRADEEQTQKKLYRAGATRVVLPYLIGGQKMARIITRPLVSEFLEHTVYDKDIELSIEELPVTRKSRLNGTTLEESEIRQKLNVIIVAIRKKKEGMQFNPSSKTRIEAEDTLIALGQNHDLKKLLSVLAGKH